MKLLAICILASGAACGTAPAPASAPAPDARSTAVPVSGAERGRSPLDGSRQLVLVTTRGWNATDATLTRWERNDSTGPWRQMSRAEAAVIGQSGLAWADDSLVGPDPAPVKREGDGRSPAGIFPLDTIFGFPSPDSFSWRPSLPYVELQQGSECVDDPHSRHYNTIVDRSSVPSVDWQSAEHMRAIGQYALGITVGYNASPPRAGRGSCIFLHIWAGPRSATAGCTAMPAPVLTDIARWLRSDFHPRIVQLTERDYVRLHDAWSLPVPTDPRSHR